MGVINVSMRSTSHWQSAAQGDELVDVLMAQCEFLVPQKIDDHEPERHNFDPDDRSKLHALWESNVGFVSLKRRKPWPSWLTVLMVPENTQRFNEIMGGIDERYLKSDADVQALLACARAMYSWGKLSHGHLCHEDDWNAKNYFGTPTRLASGKAMSSGGLFLEEGLPGIYWANFFGPPYVALFGAQKLKEAPAHHVEALPDGGYLLLSAETPLTHGTVEVREREDAIIDHLGRDAFFEKSKPTKRCQVPSFGFEKAATARPVEILEFDPVADAIPDPEAFVANAQQLAAALVRQLGADLDYSPDSLDPVDSFILKRSYRRPEPWKNSKGRELLQQLAAYYGEVLRRNLKGRWYVDEENGHPAIRYPSGDDDQVEYPFARVAELWSERQRGDGLAAHYPIVSNESVSDIRAFLGKFF